MFKRNKPTIGVYIGAAVYVGALFLLGWVHGDAGDLRIIRLTEGFALGAIVSLYCALLPTALYEQFPAIPGKNSWISAKQAFYVVALCFALVHGSLAFFKLLGGFAGWGFLGAVYQKAAVLGVMTILGIACCVAYNFFARFETALQKYPKVKSIAYALSVLVVVHASLVGSHVRIATSPVRWLGFLGVAFLFLLLALRVDKKVFAGTNIAWCTIVVAIATGLLGQMWLLGPVLARNGSASNSGAHAGMDMSSMAGMNMSMGTSSSQYTLSVQTPPNITAGSSVPFSFKVFTASTGSLVTQFNTVHDKLAHLVIVNDKLGYYSHIHPDLTDGQFTISTSFPADDNYRAYISFEPKGGAEQVFAYSFVVGKGASGAPDKTVDATAAKTFGGVTASLLGGAKISAVDVASGKAKLTFHFADSAGKPVTNLYPYLAAFGHLVMINTDTYSYLHVHPLIVPFGPEETSGPDVEFMVMGNIQPGIYKLFGQFNPNKQLITVPYTIEVTK